MMHVKLGEEFDDLSLYLGDTAMRWPIVITGANRNDKVQLSDDEARNLMRALIRRYAIDALGAISDD